MPRYTLLSLTLATLSMTAVATLAQAPDPAGQSTMNTTEMSQSQAAPIVRMDSNEPMHQGQTGTMGMPPQPVQTTLAAGQVLHTGPQVQSVEPTPGVYLRIAPHSAVRAISLGGERTEFRIERGVVNLSVHKPEKGELILVDLPGGQVQPLKNGFYTFNAQTNTTRTLRGESEIVPATAGVKAVKVKEEQALTFASAAHTGAVKAHDFAPFQARMDVIPNPATYARYGDGGGGYGYGFDPGAGFYGDGYSPYYAYGYPFGYGYGYPGFGLGFGYYGGFGGFGGGGFRHFR